MIPLLSFMTLDYDVFQYTTPPSLTVINVRMKWCKDQISKAAKQAFITIALTKLYFLISNYIEGYKGSWII